MRMRRLSLFVNNNVNAVFCEKRLEEARFRLFLERVDPRIILLESLPEKWISKVHARSYEFTKEPFTSSNC